MRLSSLALDLAFPAFAQEAPEGPPLKVAVVPFAPLSGDVPNRAGIKAAGMLANELKNTDGVAIVEIKRAAADDPYKDPLVRAR
jgi:hypothetical protein